MRATKGNKVYEVTEDQKQFYIDCGYDILDDEGNAISYGRGKTVPYEQYAKLQDELARQGEKVDDKAVVAVLQEYCMDKQIDIGKASTVSGIMKKIEEARQ